MEVVEKEPQFQCESIPGNRCHWRRRFPTQIRLLHDLALHAAGVTLLKKNLVIIFLFYFN